MGYSTCLILIGEQQNLLKSLQGGFGFSGLCFGIKASIAAKQESGGSSQVHHFRMKVKSESGFT